MGAASPLVSCFTGWVTFPMARSNRSPSIAIPKSWPQCVRSCMLHVISLAQYAAVYTRSWAADSRCATFRLKARADRADQDNALLREVTRIKDSRMAGISPHHGANGTGVFVKL